MEAVIASGGKQYRVTPGQVISVEKLEVDAGGQVEFRSVLLVTHDGGEVVVGAEELKSARVSGEVIRQGRTRKVSVVKFRRRKNYRRNRGHRQAATTVRITQIEV
jgi:large subunit ribosomal protein L21